MNNNNVQGLPNVPDEIPGWEIFTQIRGCRVDLGKNDDQNKVFRVSRRTLLLQLEGMG